MNHKINISPSLGQLDTLTRVVDLLIGNANVRTIFEFGSRYGEDSIEFAARYPQSAIYCFECNPKSLTILREKIELYSNIIFKECAISDRCEIIEFFQINEAKTKTAWVDGNQGASSIFKASGKYPLEVYHQDVINVQAITLNSILIQENIPEIDVMWMDIQGAELKALKGMGNKLANLKIVHLEVEFIEIYKGQPLFSKIDNFLKQNNFVFLGFTSKTHFSGDVIYLNSSHFTESQIHTASVLMPVENKNLVFFWSKLIFRVKYFCFKCKNFVTNPFAF